MIGRYDLIELLNKYGINGERLIGNNSNVLDYGIYKEIEEIVKFLLSKGFTPNMIEKCPSIIYWTSSKEIKDNYNWLINETEITFNDISGCLHILGSNLEEMKKIYNYVLDKYGIDTIKNCLSILNGDYLNIVSLTESLEDTIGLEIVKDGGGSILIKATSSELRKILTIPEFKYNRVTKKYNRNLLAVDTFRKSYEEIKEIFNLSYWKNNKCLPLLTAYIFRRDIIEIKEILELSYIDEKGEKKIYWDEKKYQPLLTSNIWDRTAKEIEDILILPYWKEEQYKSLLTPNVWNRTAKEIEDILILPYWKEDQYKLLLTSNIWNATTEQVKGILELSYIDENGNKKSYWEEEKYKTLLTPTIWSANVEQVKGILELSYIDESGNKKSYWEEEPYKSLLTPTIWNADPERVKGVLELSYIDESGNKKSYWEEEPYKSLLTSNIWNAAPERVKGILELSYIDESGNKKSYWEEEPYKSLLTPTIWSANVEQVKGILELSFIDENGNKKSYWKEEKYKSLLTPTMWVKNAEQIVRHIEFCENDEELKEFSNNRTLIYQITYNELVAKTNYLRANNLPVIVNGKPNTIYGMSNKNMQKKFGISKKELVRDYLNIDVSRGKKAV